MDSIEWVFGGDCAADRIADGRQRSSQPERTDECRAMTDELSSHRTTRGTLDCFGDEGVHMLSERLACGSRERLFTRPLHVSSTWSTVHKSAYTRTE